MSREHNSSSGKVDCIVRCQRASFGCRKSSSGSGDGQPKRAEGMCFQVSGASLLAKAEVSSARGRSSV
jgi:hypothetical protein